jgi:hypothetical protein
MIEKIYVVYLRFQHISKGICIIYCSIKEGEKVVSMRFSFFEEEPIDGRVFQEWREEKNFETIKRDPKRM